jgi:hypothetical protein
MNVEYEIACKNKLGKLSETKQKHLDSNQKSLISGCRFCSRPDIRYAIATKSQLGGW